MKSLKVSDEAWKAAKVFSAEHNWNLQSFVEMAIREKIISFNEAKQTEAKKNE